MDYQTIIYTKKDNVAKITLNRPERLNALTFITIEEVVTSLKECEYDDDTRAVVITGAGKAFCSGDDITGSVPGRVTKSPSELDFGSIMAGPQRLWKALFDIPKPVIAMINGLADGGGFGICLASDFRVASEDATFRYPYAASLGVAGGTELLPQYVGIGKAMEILMLGRRIEAREAEQLGLVNQVVPAGQLERAVNELATKLAGGATKAMGYVKRGLNHQRTAGFEIAAYMGLLSTQTEDAREGWAAFIGKRESKFKGK